jgi:hypothetical protein
VHAVVEVRSNQQREIDQPFVGNTNTGLGPQSASSRVVRKTIRTDET